MEKTLYVPLDMSKDEIIKMFRAGDYYESDPASISKRTVASDYRYYDFKVERHDKTVCLQKIEKYPFMGYIIRDPDTNQYFGFESLADYIIGLR